MPSPSDAADAVAVLNTAAVSTTQTVTKQELEVVDWANTSIALGVKLPDAREPWMALDPEELRVLHQLLTCPIAIDLGHGFTRMTAISMPGYEGLKELAAWAAAAGRWYERQPLPPAKG